MNAVAVTTVSRLLESEMNFTTVFGSEVMVYYPDATAEYVHGSVKCSVEIDTKAYGIVETIIRVQSVDAALGLESDDGTKHWSEVVQYPSKTSDRPEGDPEAADPKQMVHYYAQQPWEVVVERTRSDGRLVLMAVEIDMMHGRKITLTFGG